MLRMTAASAVLPDLNALDSAALKVLVIEKHALVIEKNRNVGKLLPTPRHARCYAYPRHPLFAMKCWEKVPWTVVVLLDHKGCSAEAADTKQQQFFWADDLSFQLPTNVRSFSQKTKRHMAVARMKTNVFAGTASLSRNVILLSLFIQSVSQWCSTHHADF